MSTQTSLVESHGLNSISHGSGTEDSCKKFCQFILTFIRKLVNGKHFDRSGIVGPFISTGGEEILAWDNQDQLRSALLKIKTFLFGEQFRTNRQC